MLSRLRRQAFRIALALLSIGATFQWIAPTNSAEDLSESPSHVRALASGPDGGLWFIEARANQIGRMSTNGELKQFPVPGAISLDEITAGPDGALWFVAWTGRESTIMRMTTDGEITAGYPGNQRVGLTHLVAGPDDALWFTTVGTVGPMAIGRVTTSGEISYPFQRYCSLGPPLQCAEPRDLSALPPGQRWQRGFGGITAGADGAIWFTELEPNQIGRIDMHGVVAEYPIPTLASDPGGIVAGSDGALWFVEFAANQVGRITTDGEISEYRIPTADSGLLGITADPGGDIWFTEGQAHQVGRMTAAGAFTEYPLPTAIPYGIVLGPDGAIWFVEGVSRFSQLNATGIARITSEGTITEYPLPSVE